MTSPNAAPSTMDDDDFEIDAYDDFGIETEPNGNVIINEAMKNAIVAVASPSVIEAMKQPHGVFGVKNEYEGYTFCVGMLVSTNPLFNLQDAFKSLLQVVENDAKREAQLTTFRSRLKGPERKAS